jgi:uncharacterized DUF497 family protein
VRFEWDEDKRLANIHKHGIDFADVAAVFDGDTVIIEDNRFDYGEQRFVTLGLLKGRVVVIVHTERGGVTRTISVRKATRYEEISYFERIPD